jgi:hypothetical protein
MTGAYVTVRGASRAAGSARLAGELTAYAPRVSLAAAVSEAGPAYDLLRARRAANGYVDAWLHDARELVANDVADAPRVAAAQQAWRVEVGGVTEVSQAYTAEREQAFENWARVNRVDDLWKVWDASLDKRTCQTCSAADGAVVGARESFPYGSPGGVHPNCRCTFQVVPVEWL